MSEFKFDPDWSVSPSQTLLDLREENGWSVDVLARRMKLSLSTVNAILFGGLLYENYADALEKATQVPARFWLNLERKHRAFLAAKQSNETMRQWRGMSRHANDVIQDMAAKKPTQPTRAVDILPGLTGEGK